MLTRDPSPSSLPCLGLLALALTLFTYALGQTGLVAPPPASLATVLLLGGGLQLLTGVQGRNPQNAGTMLPLGLFWLSLIGLDVFPQLGVGSHPQPAVMVAYLSMWSFFAALQFLASSRKSRALQWLFGTLMICLMLLALGNLRGNPVFLISGGFAGICSSLAAGYTALAQLCNQGAGRAILPLGNLANSPDSHQESSLVS